MRKPSKKSIEIRRFILRNILAYPRDITARVMSEYGISRPAALRHVQKLIDAGLLIAHGTTRDRSYELLPLLNETFTVRLTPDAEEDHIWRHLIRPMLHNLPENVMDICEYGMSEMINNAIDHSGGSRASIRVRQTAAMIEFMLVDDGVGIFHKIQRELDLDDPRQAILELAKGKLTTDPERHSGQGIFFSARVFDQFVVISQGLFFSLNDLLYADLPDIDMPEYGTAVSMKIGSQSTRTLIEVFDKYASEDMDYQFLSTDIPVQLARFEDENLVSRSQARRLLVRLHEFEHIRLDFKKIDMIGQAFADEIFRVYARKNLQIEITFINANQQVERMIRRARADLN